MTTETPVHTGIQQACDKAGGQTQLAQLLGVTRQSVQEWVMRGYAPTRRIIEIEAHTGVPREQLIHPKLQDILAPPFGE